ncbi:MAG: 23S rRNA (guanosine(2251)-2'-O)-methyltransferase RlmB [Bacteroidota bacterium]
MEKRKFTPRPHESDDNQMIYGIHPVLEAIRAGKEIDKIFIARGTNNEGILQVKTALKEQGVFWQEVPSDRLNRFTRKNHQDVVAFISPVAYQPIDEIVPSIFERGLTPLLLLLDRVTDVRNFGAIARTAECAGVHAIVIPQRGAASVTSDAIRTSAGALSRIPVCRVRDLKQACLYLRDSGVTLAAASEKASDHYFNADFSGPLGIIMGSEEDGVSDDIIRTCDHLVRIPMLGHVGSLNVSVAAGVLVFEAVRQRLKK